MDKEFRAWNKKSKEYEYFNFGNIFGYEAEVCGVLFPSGSSIPLNFNSGYGINGINKDLVIEQYVGLTDVEGRKIFEGDIFEVVDDRGISKHVSRLDSETLATPRENIRLIVGNIHSPR